MKLLAFDTSSTACSVALLIDGQNQEEHIQALHANAPRQQAQLILSMIQELLQPFGLRFTDLDAVAFGCGPGSFTGIRIASSVAQGIGFAAQLPLIQISSLAAVAQAAYDQFRWTTLLTALDAHMEQVYFAIYETNNRGLVEIRGEEKVYCAAGMKLTNHWIYTTERTHAIDWDIAKVDVKIGNKGEKNIAGIGNGWSSYAASLIDGLGFEPQMIEPAVLPTATAILKLAKEKVLIKDWISAAEVRPAYL